MSTASQRDVTAQRRLERALRREGGAERVRKHRHGPLLANVCHEVRTPLAAVIGMTALALETEPMPKQAGYLAKALASGRLARRAARGLARDVAFALQGGPDGAHGPGRRCPHVEQLDE